MKVITVSRSYGSGGSEFGRQLADSLGYHYADENFVKGIEQNVEQRSPLLASLEDEIGPGFIEKIAGLMDNRSFYKLALSTCLYELALKSDVVIVGAGAHLVFADYKSMLAIMVVRKLSERVRTVAQNKKMEINDALEFVEDKDKEKAKFIKNYFDKALFDPLMFHIAVNLSLVSTDQAVQFVAPLATDLFGDLLPGQSELWLKNRLLEKQAEGVLFHLGLTHGQMVEFHADGGQLTAKGVVGGKHEKKQLLETLTKISGVTAVTDELRIEVLSRMLY